MMRSVQMNEFQLRAEMYNLEAEISRLRMKIDELNAQLRHYEGVIDDLRRVSGE